MRKYLPGPVKTLTATTAETIRWSENETLNGSAIKQLHFIFTGTDNDTDTVTTFQIFAGGTLIFNLDELQFAQFLSVYGKRALAGAATTFFTIPMDWMDPSCALPPNAALRVEIGKDATGAAGTLELAYTVDEQTPAACYPLFIESAAGVAASSTAANIPITQPGLLKGLMIPDSADVTTLRLYIGGQLVWNLDQARFLLACQDIYSGVATTSAAKFLFLDVPQPITPGTRIEVNTAAGFGGAAEQFGVLSLIPNS